MASPRQAGLRLQIVIALAGLMLLAFVPLFFAVASLARATVLGAREQYGLALGRAVAAELTDAREHGDKGAVDRVLRAHDATLAPLGDRRESAREVRGGAGWELDVVTPMGDSALRMRVPIVVSVDRAESLVRLVALYMLVFALALVVFAYFALTRLIVRPVEQLVSAADRVASGARTLPVPRRGARELVELGSSVQAMAGKLISEEAALIVKVDELTETTRRLTEAQAQLVRSERLASVGRLAAGVAHEIGNPIAALMGMQDLLLDGGLSPDEQRDFLGRMKRETERIHTVVRDLLDFARPEGRAHPSGSPPPPADVRAVVGDVVSLVRPQKHFREVRVEAELDLEHGAPRVALAAPRLTQVLLNLVLNAGASIASAGRAEGRVTVRVRAEGARVRIEVEDDGPGIPAEVQGRLFEPFVTTKDVGEGTGLGLAVCRGLVESAGGEIGVDAAHQGGARFYVVLPAAS